AQLPQQNDLVTAEVNRQDCRRRSGAQNIRRPWRGVVCNSEAQALIGTKSLGQQLRACDRHIRLVIGDPAVHGYASRGLRGGAHRPYSATTPSGAVSSLKAAANRARVYSLFGRANSSAAAPSSTTLPWRMTTRPLASAATTRRSCEMNR